MACVIAGLWVLAYANAIFLGGPSVPEGLSPVTIIAVSWLFGGDLANRIKISRNGTDEKTKE